MDIKFIIIRGLTFFFFEVTFFTYTLKSIKWDHLHFHNIYRIVTLFIFYKIKNTEKSVFIFCIQIQLFRILKMKIEFKYFIQLSFFMVGRIENWKCKQKTLLFFFFFWWKYESFIKKQMKTKHPKIQKIQYMIEFLRSK